MSLEAAMGLDPGYGGPYAGAYDLEGFTPTTHFNRKGEESRQMNPPFISLSQIERIIQALEGLKYDHCPRPTYRADRADRKTPFSPGIIQPHAEPISPKAKVMEPGKRRQPTGPPHLSPKGIGPFILIKERSLQVFPSHHERQLHRPHPGNRLNRGGPYCGG